MRFPIFGLKFQFDDPLTGLSVAPAGSAIDVRVFLSDRATRDFDFLDWQTTYLSVESDPGGTPILSIQSDSSANWLRMRYFDGTDFVLDRDGSQIHSSWIPPWTAEDAATYLLGPVLGLLLYLRSLTCIHASAVEFHGKALVFVGEAESGKSTLAAAFAGRGLRVLTDDILAIVGGAGTIVAMPGVPRIGLWTESVEHLCGTADALPRQTPTWEKRYLDLEGCGLYQNEPLPVGAVYILSDRKPNTALRITPVAGVDAVLALVANKYVTRVSEREQDMRDFLLLSELASSIPVRRLKRSDMLSDLAATCEAILTDGESLSRVLV